MPSQSELTDNEDQNPLPPLISCNPRVKLEAEQVMRFLLLHAIPL